MHNPPEDASGDYEYDLAHEEAGARVEATEDRPSDVPAAAPPRRPVEFDQDMGYDEAHDF